MAIIHTCITDTYAQSGQKAEILSTVQVYDLNACQSISTVPDI